MSVGRGRRWTEPDSTTPAAALDSAAASPDGCGYASEEPVIIIGIQHIHQFEIDEILRLQSVMGMGG